MSATSNGASVRTWIPPNVTVSDRFGNHSCQISTLRVATWQHGYSLCCGRGLPGVHSPSRLDVSPFARDAGQDPPERAAGGVHGVGEIHDLDPDRGKVPFQLLALRRTAPVVALEQDVEPHGLPRLELVRDHFGNGPSDIRDLRHDRQSLVERNDREPALGQLAHLVRDDAGEQEVALALRMAEQIEMAYMEEVICTGGVADPDGHVSSKGSIIKGHQPLAHPHPWGHLRVDCN